MFTVIVPTYNRVALLAKTLESLFRQEYSDVEIVVANDGSSDGTDAYLTRLASEGRILYTKHPNRGLAATRKAGLALAHGELVAFTDDDCVLPPDWLRQLARHFEDPGVAGVGGSTATGNRENIYALTNDLVNNHFKSSLNGRPGQAPYLTGNNVAYRKKALEQVGGPDPRFRMGAEDRDLAFRVERAGGRLVYDPSIVIDHYNDADFSGFVRHQYHQGQGSRLYYAETGRGGRRPAGISLGTYLGLLVAPYRQFPFPKASAIMLLIVLAQCAVAAGFASALLAPAPRQEGR